MPESTPPATIKSAAAKSLLAQVTNQRYTLRSGQNPLAREAAFIAQQLDTGNTRYAVQRLQEDLHRLSNYPTAQKELVGLVGALDRKGQGADLEGSRRSLQGSAVIDVRAVEYNYFRDTYNGSIQRQAVLALPVCAIHMGQDYYAQRRQPAYPGHASNYYRQRHSHSHDQFSVPASRDNVRRGMEAGLNTPTATALARAQTLAARDGVTIEVTSAGRSYHEQARLYRQLNGVRPVATPGTSNHETGEAIDVRNYRQAKPYLLAAGFVHGDGRGPIDGDPWHFRYLG